MKKYSFNDDWICYKKDHENEKINVSIPHDAMQLDEKSEDSISGINTGWYVVNDYVYEKTFLIEDEYKGQDIILEFEGVYRKSKIYINNKKVATHEYGYTGFFVIINDAIRYNDINTIRVEVMNSDQPNSRWYSGTGIYRPVWLYMLPKNHIKLEGIKITTLDYVIPRIKVEIETSDKGHIKIEIIDEEEIVKTKEAYSDGIFVTEIQLHDAKLWNEDSPNLYTCRVTYENDIHEERFGIRKITCSPEEGFCINGERVILRGACIHHDNGLLGARAYEYSERRKVKILKDNGYNAIRSSHNPCSKAMLNACDELGMYLIDEYVDVWYIHKTKYDYASSVEKNYKADLEAIVSRDYNHPSVIMYSTGNEVSETAQKRGIELCGNMTQYLHELDPTRPVTCGINIFFNFLSSIGLGVYSDKRAESDAKKPSKLKAVGSQFYNNLAGIFGAEFMKKGATLYPCDVKTRDAFARIDIAGYNYGINRYKKDMKKYSERLILGTETFCSDAYKFWELAKENKRIIGDFVWSGFDYLGEVGVGAWEYKDYAPRFDAGYGWVSAGQGRIDLTGKPLSEIQYTQVAFERRDIAIGVVPVPYTNDKHSPSAWRMSNAIESWSWNGCDGMDAVVEVYSRADHISLYINGEHIETKSTDNDCKVEFSTKYYDGEVKAVSFDSSNNKIAETSLTTADDETILTLEPEEAEIKKDGDLSYVRLKYTDSKGITKPLIRGEIKVEVDGGEIIGLGSACPYYTRGYINNSNITDTYYGEAMAIIKPNTLGNMKIKAFSTEGNAEVEVKVI